MTAAGWTIQHLDLSGPDPALAPSDGPVFVIFWWRTLPLGTKAFLREEQPVSRAQLAAFGAEFIGAQLATRSQDPPGPPRATGDGQRIPPLRLGDILALDATADRLDRWATPAGASAQGLSVVVCTRDRPEALQRCLEALARQGQPPGEIIVVDNSAARTARGVCEAFEAVVYVHEPRPGLSVARNAGVRRARRPLIAFTDDDVEPHPLWSGEIVAAFERSGADAVTGVVFPATLATEAQTAFQFEMGGFPSVCTPLVFDRRFFEETCSRGSQVWRIGAGANMAFRRTVFEQVGLFDERLGAGASGCSEDSELWYRLLAHGGACLYEPRAVVFHHHRADWAGLRRQIRAYIKGHVSALVAQADRFDHPGNRRRILAQLPVHFLRTAFGVVRDNQRRRAILLTDEVRGWAAGLQYLFRSAWRADRALPALDEPPHG